MSAPVEPLVTPTRAPTTTTTPATTTHTHPDADRDAGSSPAPDDPEGHADTDGKAQPRAPRAPPRPSLRRGDSGPRVRELQERLSELGYWLETPDGSFGALTQQAVYALQKAAGIRRDGVVGPKTTRALADGIRPEPTLEGDGVEIVLGRQLLLVVRDGEVRTILNTSTGNGEEYISTAGQPCRRHDAEGQIHRLPRGRRPGDQLPRAAVATSVLPPRHRGARVGAHPCVAGLPWLCPR